MAIKELSQLKTQLNNPMQNNAFLIGGQEQYLCSTAYKLIISKLLKEEQMSSSLTVIDVEKSTGQEIYDTIEAMPMLGGIRVVVLDNPSFSKMQQDKFDLIFAALEDLPSYTAVIIHIKTSEFDYDKNKNCKNIFSIIEKIGTAIIFEKQDTKNISDFIMRTLKKSAKEISKQTAGFMVEYCGTDMSILSHELNKLAYSNYEIITEDVIREITIESVEAQIYDLSKAVANGNLDKAMDIIDKLYYLKQPAIVILSALSYYFADIYRAKTSKEGSVPIADAAISFGYKPTDFRMKNAYRDCSKYSTSVIAEILEVLAQSDFQLKSSKLSDRIILEKAVAQIFNTIRKRK